MRRPVMPTNTFPTPVTPSALMRTADKFQENCAVFGVWGTSDAAALTVLALHAMQHRGQDACGIVSRHENQFFAEHGHGKVAHCFSASYKDDNKRGQPTDERIGRLHGDAAIGHNRYATSGKRQLPERYQGLDQKGWQTAIRARNSVQPFLARLTNGSVALAHNGHLTNAEVLRSRQAAKGSLFQTDTDTEVLLHLLARYRGSFEDRLSRSLSQLEGAWSLVILTENALYATRDPYGFRPLSLGELRSNGQRVLAVASESCAFDVINARLIRDIRPGELLTIDNRGYHSRQLFTQRPTRHCIFEYVYFARADSVIDQRSVYARRKAIGRILAREQPVKADCVVPVPDSGVPSALGYAQESGLAMELGIIRAQEAGRTFIEPTGQVRNLGVRLKHNANRAAVSGKRIVLVDDSLVRGTTSRKIVELLRQAGAQEVHMRIASPPTRKPCYYGVDTPNQSELLAAHHSIAEMTRLIGVDSLGFISLDGLLKAVNGNRPGGYCDACFSGNYPTALTDLAAQTRT